MCLSVEKRLLGMVLLRVCVLFGLIITQNIMSPTMLMISGWVFQYRANTIDPTDTSSYVSCSTRGLCVYM